MYSQWMHFMDDIDSTLAVTTMYRWIRHTFVIHGFGLLVVVQLCDDERADSSGFGDTRFVDFSWSYSFVGVISSYTEMDSVVGFKS